MKKEIFVIKYKWMVILLTVVLVAAAIIPLLQTDTNSDLESYFPDTMPSRINDEKIKAIFGKSDPLIILFESDDVLNDSTLTRIKALSKKFNRMKDFDMVMSLFDAKNIKGEYGAMVVDPLVKRIPGTEKRREKLRDEIKNNELAYKLIISADFRYTTIILNPLSETTDKDVMASINTVLGKYPGNEEVSIFGMPYLRSEANQNITKDFMLLLPIGLAIMFLFLIISFRQKRGAILPFAVVAFSIILSMTIIPLLGWQLSIIGVLIPIMMIAIANDYGIHFIALYQELVARHPDMSTKEIVTKVTLYLKTPVILTGITTIVGIGGLFTHILLPAKQMGAASTIGIAFALLLSLTFIPAVIVMLKKGKVPKNSTGTRNAFFDQFLTGIANFTTKYPKQVIYIFVTFLIFATFGLGKFRLAADNNKLLPDKHPYNQTLSVANKEFGGTKIIDVVFKGDIKDPAILNKMDYYKTELELMPEVGSVTSIASMIRIMSKAINDPEDPFYDKIPDTREAVAQYLELYAMSGDPEDFEDFVDFDYTHALLKIQYQANDMKTLNSIESSVEKLMENDENVFVTGGYSLVEKELSEAVGKGQINSLIFAFVAILILLTIIFRSFSAGLLGSLPLLFTVVSIFGLMGWLGIELNIVTALLSSISIGLGVDYSIHLFWRLKSEIKAGSSYSAAIQTSLKTSGRGITINAFSVILGFSVLFLSSFPYIHSFAFLIIISILLCLSGALVLIPAICMLTSPKFLSK